MKETIKLNDFLAEVSKFSEGFAEAIKPDTKLRMNCPKCGKKASHLLEAKFCAEDGTQLIEETYIVKTEKNDSEIRNLFYDLSEGLELGESFPYEFVDTYESRDDDHVGDKYFINFIFRRKSDDKHFEFTMDSWDDLGGNALYEVKKKIKKTTTWE